MQRHHVNTGRKPCEGLGVEIIKHHYPPHRVFHFNHDAHPVFCRIRHAARDALPRVYLFTSFSAIFSIRRALLT